MRYYLTDSIYLNVTKNEAIKVAHIGDNEAEVKALLEKKRIKKQLENITDEQIKNHLSDTGGWLDEELENRQDNEVKLLWIACWDIKENILVD